MEWELSKENVQPLKEGRNVEKLNASLKARMEAPLKAKVSEEHRKMVEAIDSYTGDDPLQPWIECIKWVKEHFPSGGSQSRLLQLLELCARTFCKEAHYANDIRYLKVWMDYADRCTDPREIYTFLQDNSIGQQHALFYEHCGRYWEHQHKFSQAQAVYDLGIARKAQPLDSLRMAYKSFLQRASAESAAKDDARSPSAQGHPGRTFGMQITGQSRGKALQQARQNNVSRPNRCMPQQFSVFVDPEFQSNLSLQRPHGSKFMTEVERNKENIQHPSKWAGVKIPHATKTIAASEFKLDVFRDDEPIENKLEEMPQKKKVSASRALRLDDINGANREEDKLKQNPLVYFEEDDFLL